MKDITTPIRRIQNVFKNIKENLSIQNIGDIFVINGDSKKHKEQHLLPSFSETLPVTHYVVIKLDQEEKQKDWTHIVMSFLESNDKEPIISVTMGTKIQFQNNFFKENTDIKETNSIQALRYSNFLFSDFVTFFKSLNTFLKYLNKLNVSSLEKSIQFKTFLETVLPKEDNKNIENLHKSIETKALILKETFLPKINEIYSLINECKVEIQKYDDMMEEINNFREAIKEDLKINELQTLLDSKNEELKKIFDNSKFRTKKHINEIKNQETKKFQLNRKLKSLIYNLGLEIENSIKGIHNKVTKQKILDIIDFNPTKQWGPERKHYINHRENGKTTMF